MSTSIDFETRRQIGDIQAGIARLDSSARRRPPRPGQAIIQRTAAQLARVCGDEALAQLMESKAATAPAMTTVSTWASELTATGLPGFVLSLERQSALAAILTRSPQVGTLANGAIKVPVAGLAPPARIVAEGAPIPVLKGAFTPLNLAPFKLSAICHFSHELAEFSMIENAVRVLLGQSIAAGLDIVAFGTTLPGGLLNGVTPITASVLTPASAALVADLKALLAALTSPGADIIFVMSPQNALYATAVLPPSFLYPIVASSALAAGQVVCVNAAAVAAAISAEPQIKVSESAAVHEEDTTPLPLSATGSPNVVAAPLRASFQSDVSLMRISAPVAWGARAGAVSTIASVSW